MKLELQAVSKRVGTGFQTWRQYKFGKLFITADLQKIKGFRIYRQRESGKMSNGAVRAPNMAKWVWIARIRFIKNGRGCIRCRGAAFFCACVCPECGLRIVKGNCRFAMAGELLYNTMAWHAEAFFCGVAQFDTTKRPPAALINWRDSPPNLPARCAAPPLTHGKECSVP